MISRGLSLQHHLLCHQLFAWYIIFPPKTTSRQQCLDTWAFMQYRENVCPPTISLTGNRWFLSFFLLFFIHSKLFSHSNRGIISLRFPYEFRILSQVITKNSLWTGEMSPEYKLGGIILCFSVHRLFLFLMWLYGNTVCRKSSNIYWKIFLIFFFYESGSFSLLAKFTLNRYYHLVVLSWNLDSPLENWIFL